MREIPTPPPPPSEPMPMAGTTDWARWHLRHTFSPDHAVIIEWLATWKLRHARLMEYAAACHTLKWAGWQAALVWNVVETLTAPLEGDWDDDIPF